MKIYIAGPMSGRPRYNYAAFADAAATLRSQLFKCVNPHEKTEMDKEYVDGQRLWHRYLRRDLKLLVDCDAVCALEGWPESDGARLEVTVAFELGMPIYRLVNDRLQLVMHAPHRAEKRG